MITVANLSEYEQLELLQLLEMQDKEQSDLVKYNKINYFTPYEWQKNFMAQTADNKQIALMAANRIGKTYTGAFALACHLTGNYPDWWKGHRFTHPIKAWAVGITSETTRDTLQYELVGDPMGEKGTGAIPKDCIGAHSAGSIKNSIGSIQVMHKSGAYSTLSFKSYQQGQDKFMGFSVDYIWLDEEAPRDIYTQCITRTATTSGYVVLTFTPEKGKTKLVTDFMESRSKGRILLRAGWNDAPHLDEETKNQLLEQYDPAERKMRSEGIPVFGSGMVYPLAEHKITCKRFDIPDHFRQIAAIDFGWDHPFACVWLAYDEDEDIIYVTDTFTQRMSCYVEHANTIKEHLGSEYIPIMWPHDGLNTEKGSGEPLADQYRSTGINMHFEHFSNPPSLGKSRGNNHVQPGIMAIYQRMRSGKFKVFSDLEPWLKEFRGYHRKEDGKIYKHDDDLMDATRYGAQTIQRYGVARAEATIDPTYDESSWDDLCAQDDDMFL